MKYVMTLIWSMLLSFIVSYVLSSMAGDPFILTQAIVLGIIFFLAVIGLGTVVASDKQTE